LCVMRYTKMSMLSYYGIFGILQVFGIRVLCNTYSNKIIIANTERDGMIKHRPPHYLPLLPTCTEVVGVSNVPVCAQSRYHVSSIHQSYQKDSFNPPSYWLTLIT